MGSLFGDAAGERDFAEAQAELHASLSDFARDVRDDALSLQRRTDAGRRRATDVRMFLRLGIRDTGTISIYRRMVSILESERQEARRIADFIAEATTTIDGIAAPESLRQRLRDALSELREACQGMVDALDEQEAMREELTEVVAAVDVLGSELVRDKSADAAAMKAMGALRQRARATGAPAFWGEPIFDDDD